MRGSTCTLKAQHNARRGVTLCAAEAGNVATANQRAGGFERRFLRRGDRRAFVPGSGDAVLV